MHTYIYISCRVSISICQDLIAHTSHIFKGSNFIFASTNFILSKAVVGRHIIRNMSKSRKEYLLLFWIYNCPTPMHQFMI